jgi:hypothetical protein
MGAGIDKSVQCPTTASTTAVQSPSEAENFSSGICVKTSSEAHPASYQWVPGVFSSGFKRGRGVTLATYPT